MSSLAKENLSRIQCFYKDKVILLTGATGFIGMGLLEKLLRSCPDIRCIYILVRDKKGLNAPDRLKTLINAPLFSRLKQEQPTFSEKLKVVHGDLHKPKLDLSQNDEALLIQHVDIVFHCAATVKFTEKLKVAIEINLAATKDLCQIAQKMDKLKAFVYISTAYTNCEKDFIPEKVLPPLVSSNKILGLIDLLEDCELDKITPSLIHPKPNTYVFSKSAAEEVVFKCSLTLPVAILRPSIVGATVEEPLSGWVNNPQSVTGVVYNISAGIMHTFISKSDFQANIVPMDTVVNAIIALGYSVASKKWEHSKGGEGMPIINCVAKSYNCITWKEFFHLLNKYVYENPSQNLVWYPFFSSPQYRWTASIQRSFQHHLPTVLIDYVSAKWGKTTKLRRNIYKQLDMFEDTAGYFGTHKFVFEEKNADLLWEMLEHEDQQLFPFKMADMKWADYIKNYVLGCRRYLLKEDDSTLPASRYKIKLLYLIHVMAKAALILMVGTVCWFIIRLFGANVLGNPFSQSTLLIFLYFLLVE